VTAAAVDAVVTLNAIVFADETTPPKTAPLLPVTAGEAKVNPDGSVSLTDSVVARFVENVATNASVFDLDIAV